MRASSPPRAGPLVHLGQSLLALGMVLLGTAVVWQGSLVQAAANHSGIGPGLFPAMIGSGLSLIGLLLGWQALHGGWRDMPVAEGDSSSSGADTAPSADWWAFGLVSLGVLLHMLIIAWAGFCIASALLYALVARGFGSQRAGRDIVIAALLVTVVYLLFTRGLGLNLPAGLLRFGA